MNGQKKVFFTAAIPYDHLEKYALGLWFILKDGKLVGKVHKPNIRTMTTKCDVLGVPQEHAVVTLYT